MENKERELIKLLFEIKPNGAQIEKILAHFEGDKLLKIFEYIQEDFLTIESIESIALSGNNNFRKLLQKFLYSRKAVDGKDCTENFFNIIFDEKFKTKFKERYGNEVSLVMERALNVEDYTKLYEVITKYNFEAVVPEFLFSWNQDPTETELARILIRNFVKDKEPDKCIDIFFEGFESAKPGSIRYLFVMLCDGDTELQIKLLGFFKVTEHGSDLDFDLNEAFDCLSTVYGEVKTNVLLYEKFIAKVEDILKSNYFDGYFSIEDFPFKNLNQVTLDLQQA